MFFFVMLMLFLMVVFCAANIASAVAALVGLSMVFLHLTHRNKSFWPWLIAYILLLGGMGSLGGAWGLYYIVGSSWKDTNWLEASWLAGYITGGAVGVILGATEVIRWKRETVKHTWGTLTKIFQATADEISEMP